MPSRNRLYCILALCLNTLLVTFLLLDSKSLNPFTIDLDLLSSTSREKWGYYPLQAAQTAEPGSITRPGVHAPACGMCAANSTLCEELGEVRLNQATWNQGTGVRLKRFLAKAASGKGFTVGVVGGSVSAGHGLAGGGLGNWTELTTPHNMNRAIFDHLDALFPAPAGQVIGEIGGNGKNGFVNGAQGGIGSDYFSMCFGEHVPEELDLVLVDVSINDELYLKNMDSYELLVRGLLDLPNKPAIINLHIFALLFHQIALGGDLHSGINQFYDIPTISIRGPYLGDLLADPEKVKEFFLSGMGGTDLRHLSANGHRRMAELVKAFIDWQICEMVNSDPRKMSIDLDELYPVPPLPRQLLMQKYDPDVNVPPLKPMCLSANGLKHKLEPTENEGWEHWNWEKKHYLRATVPKSRVGIPFTTSLGTVQLHYLRSAIFGLGSVKCWVDDEVDKSKVVIAYWEEIYNIGRSITIRDDLAPGDHILKCEVMSATADPRGGHEFRIISVMSI